MILFFFSSMQISGLYYKDSDRFSYNYSKKKEIQGARIRSSCSNLKKKEKKKSDFAKRRDIAK